MNVFDDRLEYGSWKAPGHSLLIEYPYSVVGHIASAVMEAFRREVTQGAEVGGILFGCHYPDLVQIRAWRLLAVAEGDSPRLQLTGALESEIERLLRSSADDPRLRGLVPVGWVQSTNRRTVSLVDSSLQIFERYFREPWQVALVIRPSFQRPTMAGFFFREANGRFQVEGSYREFMLLESGQESSSDEPGSMAEFSTVHPPAGGLRAAPPPKVEAPAAPRRFPRWTIGLCVALLLIAAAIFALPKLRSKPAPASASMAGLALYDRNTRLYIRWDPASALVRQSSSARAIITDGDRTSEVKLDAEALAGGALDYQRMGEDVTVRLVFQAAGKAPVTESARFVGQTFKPKPDAQETVDRVAELEAELARARKETAAERNRADILEQAVRALQQRVNSNSR